MSEAKPTEAAAEATYAIETYLLDKNRLTTRVAYATGNKIRTLTPHEREAVKRIIDRSTGLAKKEAALRAAQVWLEHPATHDAFRKDAALYEQLEATCVQVQYALTQGA